MSSVQASNENLNSLIYIYAAVAELADLPAGRQARKDSKVYSVYAIKSKNRNYVYVGLTDNIDRRFLQHNTGREKTTRAYAPFKLIYTQEFATRVEARRKEKVLKSGYGKEFLKSLS